MKLARSLILLPVLAALSLASCTQTRHVVGNGYNTVTYGPDSFGGHGGGYGSGYAIWPMPTDNYAMYGTPPTFQAYTRFGLLGRKRLLPCHAGHTGAEL